MPEEYLYAHGKINNAKIPMNIIARSMPKLIIVGGGLAGCEAAWQAAKQGKHVSLYEMRPGQKTGAHQTSDLAELVCSNSLGSSHHDRASGLLKEELRIVGSLLLDCAEKTKVPAGGALAVDRNAFSKLVTQSITAHPNIELIREEVPTIPSHPAIIASGPLTSKFLSEAIQSLTGQDHLYFFDAIAPIVSSETINMEIAFHGSRYCFDRPGEGDYINCPFTKEQYECFVEALLKAERIPLRDFEMDINKGIRAGAHKFFEGCLPIEILAQRGQRSLAYGPMRPVGIKNPCTGKGAYAIVQLRQDNLIGSLYNLVGFQTNLTYSEQKRIFRMIPGLENAEFIRYGQMHRNTFIASPKLVLPTLQMKTHEHLFFAGQITGIEGYMGNIASGLVAGINASNYLKQKPLVEFPKTTLLGALCYYITHADFADFQPMKANFGILPELTVYVKDKRERANLHAARSIESLQNFLVDNNLELPA
jgi:methylenetetrahydrofolate--tRNA-(uracil-5-)-methyltransferase